MNSGGILLIDKPKGITSTKVVEKVRKRLKTKVGHTGTLDPIATGLLILLVGKATRFSWIFLNMDKTYRVKALLGIKTDTYDLEGEVLESREVKVSCEDLVKATDIFVGEIEQTPPPFSAKKVKGKRAYSLARKGLTPELKPVRVKVYEIELISCEIPEFELRIKVSSGTYVRSLIHDIGKELSTGAVVKELVREEIGPFSLKDSVSLKDFLNSEDPWDYVIPVEEALSFLPKVSLDYFNGKKVLSGNPVLVGNGVKEGYVRIYIDDTFVGIGLLRSGVLKPERLLISGEILKT